MTSGNDLGFHRYNPEIHHRRSIRLQNYDYSQPGYYFITLCIHDRWLRIFGDIIDGKMEFNECGIIITEWIGKIPKRYDGTTIDSHVVMPNHVHMIVHLNSGVGAIHELPLRNNNTNTAIDIHELPLRDPTVPSNNMDWELNRKNRRIMTIPMIVGYFRMNTAKRINIIRKTPGNQVWQRNYWEHIIRDNRELFAIRQYIMNNPRNWERDKLNGLPVSGVREETPAYGESVWMV